MTATSMKVVLQPDLTSCGCGGQCCSGVLIGETHVHASNVEMERLTLAMILYDWTSSP